MAINKYYVGQPVQYESSFVPTQLPWDLVMKAGAQKQGAYDKQDLAESQFQAGLAKYQGLSQIKDLDNRAFLVKDAQQVKAIKDHIAERINDFANKTASGDKSSQEYRREWIKFQNEMSPYLKELEHYDNVRKNYEELEKLRDSYKDYGIDPTTGHYFNTQIWGYAGGQSNNFSPSAQVLDAFDPNAQAGLMLSKLKANTWAKDLIQPDGYIKSVSGGGVSLDRVTKLVESLVSSDPKLQSWFDLKTRDFLARERSYGNNPTKEELIQYQTDLINDVIRNAQLTYPYSEDSESLKEDPGFERRLEAESLLNPALEPIDVTSGSQAASDVGSMDLDLSTFKSIQGAMSLLNNPNLGTFDVAAGLANYFSSVNKAKQAFDQAIRDNERPDIIQAKLAAYLEASRNASNYAKAYSNAVEKVADKLGHKNVHDFEDMIVLGNDLQKLIQQVQENKGGKELADNFRVILKHAKDRGYNISKSAFDGIEQSLKKLEQNFIEVGTGNSFRETGGNTPEEERKNFINKAKKLTSIFKSNFDEFQTVFNKEQQKYMVPYTALVPTYSVDLTKDEKGLKKAVSSGVLSILGDESSYIIYDDQGNKVSSLDKDNISNFEFSTEDDSGNPRLKVTVKTPSNVSQSTKVGSTNVNKSTKEVETKTYTVVISPEAKDDYIRKEIQHVKTSAALTGDPKKIKEADTWLLVRENQHALTIDRSQLSRLADNRNQVVFTGTALTAKRLGYPKVQFVPTYRVNPNKTITVLSLNGYEFGGKNGATFNTIEEAQQAIIDDIYNMTQSR